MKNSELIRFGFVGAIAVVVQYGIYYLALLLVSHNIAYTIGYFISFTINYLLTTSYTFKTRRSASNGLGFTMCHVINYLMQVGLLNVFIYMGLSKEYSPIPVFAFCVPTNFLLVRWVMKRC